MPATISRAMFARTPATTLPLVPTMLSIESLHVSIQAVQVLRGLSLSVA